MSALNRIIKIDPTVELTPEGSVIFKIFSSRDGRDREWDFEATSDQLEAIIASLNEIVAKRRRGSA